MQRRVLAAIAAFALALVGAVLLLSYVSGADERARASEETVQVLVAQAPIAAGTPANQIVAKVDLEDVPARLVAEDAITDLAEFGDRPTTGAMLPGDQLSAGRFAERTAVKERDGEEVSLTLDAQRAVGGALAEGDRVAVYLTRTTDGVSTSTRIYDDVEVTHVSGVDDSSAVSTGGITVTLALTPEQATTVVAGMHDGAVWLSLVTKSEV
ncbi:pilus assembly protein CpaB [Blastococcus fimeti]|nr:pilus assembly protein CpaB [Blastococcus fimeti]